MLMTRTWGIVTGVAYICVCVCVFLCRLNFELALNHISSDLN